jgi:hypothetical protein
LPKGVRFDLLTGAMASNTRGERAPIAEARMIHRQRRMGRVTRLEGENCAMGSAVGWFG